MTVEIFSPEMITWAEIAVSLAPCLLQLTRRQRQAILNRDNHQCQFPMYSEEKGFYNCGSEEELQVHHIEPQRWLEKVQGLPRHQRDVPRNLLTVCKAHHQGQIHPDTGEALDRYRSGDKNAFEEMMDDRDQLIEEGVKYWNDDMDDLMKHRARELTGKARAWGWTFPRLKKRRKRGKI